MPTPVHNGLLSGRRVGVRLVLNITQQQAGVRGLPLMSLSDRQVGAGLAPNTLISLSGRWAGARLPLISLNSRQAGVGLPPNIAQRQAGVGCAPNITQWHSGGCGVCLS